MLPEIDANDRGAVEAHTVTVAGCVGVIEDEELEQGDWVTVEITTKSVEHSSTAS